MQIAEAFVRVRALGGSQFTRELDQQTRPGLQRLERQMTNTNREFSRFGRGALVGTGALGALGRAAAFASTSFIGGAGLIYGIKSAVGAASNLNEQLSKTRVVFGDSSAEVEAFAKDALLLAQDQALETASAFGALLVPLGVIPGKAADLSISLTKLGVDLSSFSNTSVPDALNAIRSGLVGEVEPLRRYGVVLSEARVQQEAFRETGKSSADQLTNSEKVFARYNLILKDTKQAQGDAQRTFGGFANQQRELQKNIRDTEALIGQALIPKITELTTQLNKWLGNTENQERIQRDLNRAIDTGATVVGALSGALQIAKDVAEPLVGIVGGLANAVKLLVLAMAVKKVAAFAGALKLVGPAAIAAGEGIAAGEAIATRGGGLARFFGGRGALGALGPLGTAVAGGLVLDKLFDKQSWSPAEVYKMVGKGGANAELARKALASAGLPGALTFMDVFPALQAGMTVAGVQALRVRFASDGDYEAALAWARQRDLGKKKALVDAARHVKPDPIGAGTTGPLPATQTVSRDVATSTALAKAQAEGSTAEIRAAAEARLKVIDDQIAFAKKLEGQRGKTKQLEAALQKFYGDEESTQGIIDQINAEAASAQERAAAEAKTKAEQRAAKAKTLAEQAARAREKAFLDSVQIKERTLRTAVKASHDGKAADSALLVFYRKEAHDARLSGVARAEFAGKAVDEQQRENQVAKTRAETLRRGLTLGANVIGDFLQEQLKARQRAAKAVETRLTLREGALGIARQVADLAVARAGDNEKLLGKAEAAERRADQRLIAFYKKRIAETRGLERQGYREKLIAAQLDLAGLKKEKAKATTGYTLDELFKEAGNQEALYGSNIGGADTPLSAQEAHGKFGGIVKTHQTVVVQNFYGPTRPNQAMNDARSSARNLK